MKRSSSFLFIFLCIIFIPLHAESDTTQNLEPPEFPEGLDLDAAFLAKISGLFVIEDPTSLYSFSIKDKEVEFLLDGTWEMNLFSILDISFDGENPVITPPIFAQTVNLASWIFIDNTWYFESYFAEEFTKNTVAAGYIGDEDTAIKHVRIGNSGIKFPDSYPFISVGGGTAIAPGIMGTFEGNKWNADAILRYDTAISRELLLSGMNEVTDEYIPITQYVKNKWFVLPDTYITGSVSVFIQEDSGSIRDAKGRKWRELHATEFTVKGIDGTLELTSETNASVAIIYRGNYGQGMIPGSNLENYILETRSWFASPLVNVPATVLDRYFGSQAGNAFRDFLANRFLLEIDGKTALLLHETGYFSPFGIASRYQADGTDQEIVYKESGITLEAVRAVNFDESYTEIFRQTSMQSTSQNSDPRSPEFRFPLAREFSLLYFPSNGGQKPDTDLSIRSRTYKEISSITLGQDAINGTIAITRNGIQDNAFLFDDSTGTLTLLKQPISTENIRITWMETDPTARNATFTLAGGIRWLPNQVLSFASGSALRWNISQDGYTDYAEKSPGSFIVSTEFKYDGAIFHASSAFAFETSVYDTIGFYRILGMDDREKTFYPEKNWFASVPAKIEPTLGFPLASIRTLEAGNRSELSGVESNNLPSIKDSSVSGYVLDMSGIFTRVENWAGAEIRAGSLGNMDFSTAKTVSIALKNPGDSDNFEIFLQLGTRDDPDYEDPVSIRTWAIPTPAPNSNWIIRTIILSDEDRRIIGEGTDMRIIIIPAGGTDSTEQLPLAFHLLSGPIEITETDFTIREESGISINNSLSVRETFDRAVQSLEKTENSTITRFNKNGSNTVLEAIFTPSSSMERITISKNVPPIPLSQYKSLSFFIKPEVLPESSGSSLRILFSRPSGESERETAIDLEVATSTLDVGVWQKITVDLADASVLKNGTRLASEQAHVTRHDTRINPTDIEVSFVSWTPVVSYTVFLDEFYLEESKVDNSIKNESTIGWKKDGSVLSAGSFSIVSNPFFSATAYSSKSSSLPDPVLSGIAEAGLTLLRMRADGAVTASSSNPHVTDSISHTVNIPLGPLSADEKFTTDFAGNAVRREDTLAFSKYISANIGTGVQTRGRYFDRKASFRISPNIPSSQAGIFYLSADSKFFQTGVSPFMKIEDSAWSEIWKESFDASLSTGERNALKRTIKATLTAAWDSPQMPERKFGLAGISFVPSGESIYNSAARTIQEEILTYTFSIPFDVLGTSVTPFWKRTASQTETSDIGGSYFTDADNIKSALGEMDWLFSFPPIQDLFNPEIPEIIRNTENSARLFENLYEIKWKRPSPGLLRDLFLPTTIDTSIARKTETDASVENFSDAYTASIKSGYSALNIAGTYGILNLFSWYEQDEISQLYAWTAKWGKGFYTWKFDAWDSIMIFMPKKATIAIENIFHYDSPSIAGTGELYRNTVKGIWKRPGKDTFVALLARKWTEMPISTFYEDSVSFGITRLETIDTQMDYDRRITTRIGLNGEISMYGGVGYVRTGEGLTTMQFRLGIGGKLTY